MDNAGSARFRSIKTLGITPPVIPALSRDHRRSNTKRRSIPRGISFEISIRSVPSGILSMEKTLLAGMDLGMPRNHQISIRDADLYDTTLGKRK